MTVRVGVTRAAHFLPETRLTVEALAELTGRSAESIFESTGMREKRVARVGETAMDFALEAGRRLLQDVDPKSIDLLIYTSGSLTDAPLWWGIYKLHELLGLEHARFLEMHYGCIGSLHALEAAKNYMLADPGINRAIVIGAESYHFSETFPNYRRLANEPMDIFADGAAAVLLESDRVAPLSNALGTFRFMVDSDGYADTPIPAGGAKNPTTRETVEAGLHALNMAPQDPGALRSFGIRYIRNYLTVIRQSLDASGIEGNPDFLISNQLKRPLLQILLKKLGLDESRTVYTLPETGHVGTADILIGLGEVLREGQLAPGQAASIVSSGVGFSWGAATLHAL